MDVLSRFPSSLYWDDLVCMKRGSVVDAVKDVLLFCGPPHQSHQEDNNNGYYSLDKDTTHFKFVKSVIIMNNNTPTNDVNHGGVAKLKNKSHSRISVLLQEWELTPSSDLKKHHGMEFDVYSTLSNDDDPSTTPSLVLVPKSAILLGYKEVVLGKKGSDNDTFVMRDLNRVFGLVSAKILLDESVTKTTTPQQVKCDFMDTSHHHHHHHHHHSHSNSTSSASDNGSSFPNNNNNNNVNDMNHLTKHLPRFYLSPLLDHEGYSFTNHQVQLSTSNHCLDATPLVPFRDWRVEYTLMKKNHVPLSVMEDILVAKFLHYDVSRFSTFLLKEMEMSQFDVETVLSLEEEMMMEQ